MIADALNAIGLNNAILIFIAILNLITAFVAMNTRTIAQRTEVNTNSMRERLVEVTGDAAHAAGLTEGREAGEATAATLAKGQAQGRAQERASGGTSLLPAGEAPVPVTDDRVAVATERIATATEEKKK